MTEPNRSDDCKDISNLHDKQELEWLHKLENEIPGLIVMKDWFELHARQSSDSDVRLVTSYINDYSVLDDTLEQMEAEEKWRNEIST